MKEESIVVFILLKKENVSDQCNWNHNNNEN